MPCSGPSGSSPGLSALSPLYLSAADAALAAIGLDDVETAVERAAVPLMAYTRVPDQLARLVLEAAFGAVNEAQDG